jgi:hypothetical protein
VAAYCETSQERELSRLESRVIDGLLASLGDSSAADTSTSLVLLGDACKNPGSNSTNIGNDADGRPSPADDDHAINPDDMVSDSAQTVHDRSAASATQPQGSTAPHPSVDKKGVSESGIALSIRRLSGNTGVVQSITEGTKAVAATSTKADTTPGKPIPPHLRRTHHAPSSPHSESGGAALAQATSESTFKVSPDLNTQHKEYLNKMEISTNNPKATETTCAPYHQGWWTPATEASDSVQDPMVYIKDSVTPFDLYKITYPIASRLMLKAGWQPGCGLGSQRQGIAEPIMHADELLRTVPVNNGGIGSYDSQKIDLQKADDEGREPGGYTADGSRIQQVNKPQTHEQAIQGSCRNQGIKQEAMVLVSSVEQASRSPSNLKDHKTTLARRGKGTGVPSRSFKCKDNVHERTANFFTNEQMVDPSGRREDGKWNDFYRNGW